MAAHGSEGCEALTGSLSHCIMHEVRIAHFNELSKQQIRCAAELLVEAFRHMPSAWATMADAEAEVATFIDNTERIGFAAVDDQRILGWIGGLRYTAHAWELHPLVVDPEYQRRGVGRALVGALEQDARSEGVSLIWLGTDDDFGGTSLYDVDVFPNALEHLTKLAVTAGHPFMFYRRLGYEVVGMLPDVNGFGRPDILMAKRIMAR